MIKDDGMLRMGIPLVVAGSVDRISRFGLEVRPSTRARPVTLCRQPRMLAQTRRSTSTVTRPGTLLLVLCQACLQGKSSSSTSVDVSMAAPNQRGRKSGDSPRWALCRLRPDASAALCCGCMHPKACQSVKTFLRRAAFQLR
jgi:hypothetical protein